MADLLSDVVGLLMEGGCGVDGILENLAECLYVDG